MLITPPLARVLALLIAMLALAFPRSSVAQFVSTAARPGLRSFGSEWDLERYLGDIADRQNPRSCSAAPARVSTVAANGDATRRPAIIWGRVRTTTGNPLGGTRLTIGQLALTAQTEPNGQFRFVIPAHRLTQHATLTIGALGIGYQAQRGTLRAAPGDSIRVDFSLCAPPPQLRDARVAAYASAAPLAKAENITNVQHAGVDEGDIVKLSGQYLVVLRRGRLFTLNINDKALDPVSTSDAFGRGIDPNGAWYDELLLYRDKVVVVGYSYARGGTEVGLFRLDERGRLSHLGTYHLKSNDYYSSRNYASRLIGGTLVFYTPPYARPSADDPLSALPTMRKWHPGATAGEFQRIVTARRVYQPAAALDANDVALHTVTTCDLAGDDFNCQATVVVGPSGRVFYVSPKAVYVWASSWRSGSGGDRPPSIVYRMPLDGSQPTALGVSGSPIDQFSFLESDDGFLNVLVRAEGKGDAMWRAEGASGSAALLRVSIGRFADGGSAAPRAAYRSLPAPEGYSVQNRFVGDFLLYGAGNGWGQPQGRASTLFAVRWKEGWINELSLSHPIDRIEPMGNDAVVVGADERSLHFSGVALGQRLEARQHYSLANAAQGELRSHGFFYRQDGAESGLLGLPVRSGGQPGYSHLIDGSASVLFIRNRDRKFEPLGNLAAQNVRSVDDGCKASCVDWYGNARPLFIRDRVFALLGYELVEGSVRGGQIEEVRRVGYGPRALSALGR